MRKLQRAACRRNSQSHTLRAPKFGGEIIATDHQILSEEGESRNDQRYAIVVQDFATLLNAFKVTHAKNTNFTRNDEKSTEVSRSWRKTEGVTHTDNSLEYGNACEDRSSMAPIARQHLIDLGQTELLKVQKEDVKERYFVHSAAVQI